MRRWGLWLMLAVLAAGFALWRAQQPARSLQAGRLASFAPAGVARITIEVPKEPKVALVRKGAGWEVAIGGKRRGRADAAAVDRLLGALSRARIVRIAARSRRHDADFRLDPGSRTRVVLADAAGRTLLRLAVGKQSAGELVSTYVRRNDEDAVLAVDEALVWLVRRPADAWLAPKQAKRAGEKKPSGAP